MTTPHHVGQLTKAQLLIADALLPVVDRIANERTAATLEAAAKDDDARPIRWPGSSGEWLRTRAAALRASNGEGTT